MANAHRIRNCFKSISINDRKLDKEADIKDRLVDAFQNLLSAPSGWSLSLLDFSFNEIGLRKLLGWRKDFQRKKSEQLFLDLTAIRLPIPMVFP